MAVTPGLNPTTVSQPRLNQRRGWVLLSGLLVMIFLASAVISIPELILRPGQSMGDSWSRAQLEAILSPLGIPAGWLVWSRLLMEIGFAATAFLVAAAIFANPPKDRFSDYVAFWLVMHGGFSGMFATTVAALHPALAPITRGLLMAGWFGLFLLAYVFPTGAFVPRWTVIVLPLFAAAFALYIPSYGLGLGEPAPVLGGLLLALAFGGLLAQGYRYARVSSPVERQQARLVWFAIAARVGYVLVISIPAVRQLHAGASLAGLALQVFLGLLTYSIAALLPVAVGVAILRYRLWDIDPLLNRALVYGGLSLFIVGSYGLLVGGIGLLVGAQGVSPLLSILTTGLIAILFQPLRERLQRTANRLIYGQRDEPYQLLARLGRRLESAMDPASALALTVETIAQALKLPYAAITAVQPGQAAAETLTIAEYGDLSAIRRSDLARFPLLHAGEQIGELLAAPRAANEPFSATDRRLLGDLAPQVSLAARAALLSAELQAARLRIVDAREETRRRLGSDLHDGIGHQLTGLARAVELAASQEQDLQPVLAEINRQLNAAIGQVRALAHQLHPPELQVLGLVGALREQAQAHPGLALRFELPAPLPPLPAAVETAAYYIALEALNNIEKHARASSCTLRLAVSSPASRGPAMLALTIRDDGAGLPPASSGGLGLISMQARAIEVGGDCQLSTHPAGGTSVTVSLPFQPASPGA
jgi:signal transduction histidine kinase